MVMDIYVMLKLNKDYIEQELSSIGLNEFGKNVRELGRKWLEADAPIQADDLLFELAEYILGNRNYGNLSDCVVNFEYEAKGSKACYFIYVAFPSLARMQSVFPWLRKYPVLLPVAWIIRFVKALRERKHNVVNELSIIKSIDKDSMEQGKQLSTMFKKYGL